MSLKGLFFDAADVFYCRPQGTTEYALGLLEAGGYPRAIPPEDLTVIKTLQGQASAGKIGYEAFWHDFLRRHCVTDAGRRASLIEQILRFSNQVYPLPGASTSVVTLKRRGFILGIVTDTMYPLAWKMNWLAQVGVAPYIDVVSCSSTLGTHKPDPIIYLDAVRQAGLGVSESAFVGHDAHELDGARRVGLATIAVRHDPDAKADYYAKSLDEMLDLPILAEAEKP